MKMILSILGHVLVMSVFKSLGSYLMTFALPWYISLFIIIALFICAFAVSIFLIQLINEKLD